VLLRTHAGAVWSDAVRKTALLDTDGVIAVIDPQTSREDKQSAFFAELAATMRAILFDPSDVPKIAVINKTDLVDVGRVNDIRMQFEASGWPVYETCARRGAGVQEAFSALMLELSTRRRTRLNTMDGEVALRLSSWTPFKAPPA
jgi:signal recognition particle receptor subunit beta